MLGSNSHCPKSKPSKLSELKTPQDTVESMAATMTGGSISTRIFSHCTLLLSLCVTFLFHHRHHHALANSSPTIFPAFAKPASRHATAPSLTFSRDRTRKTIIPLAAVSNNKPDGRNIKPGNMSRAARERGIYSRPSAAIERGSGFFVPGLEGSRIRFIFGITILVADAANHMLVGGKPGDIGQFIAETLAAFYGTLLLLQGSIELGVEMGYAQGNDSSLNIDESFDGGIEEKTGQDIVSRGEGSSGRFSKALLGDEVAMKVIQRMAQSIINFTPATYFQFADEDLGVLYSFGANDDVMTDGDTEEQKRLIKLSLDAVSGSRGGRVALSNDHPASKLLPECATRCILIQKINGYKGGRGCLVIGSNRLLLSFTKNDLRWIGRLAQYSNMVMDR